MILPAENIKRGTPGREQELKNWIAAVEAIGKVGIPVFNLGQGGKRTANVVVRGGAISTAHDLTMRPRRNSLLRRRSNRRSTLSRGATEVQVFPTFLPD
jgi:hypothetical protein